jgi:hypothetical protein
MVTRTCSQCHKTYDTFPSIKPVYCSQKCASEAKKNGEYIACQQCGKQVYSQPNRPRKFCSWSCATIAKNLSDRNPAYHRDVSGANNPMYGKPGQVGEANGMYGRTGSANPNWHGGRKVRKDGYVLVVAPKDHPYPADASSGMAYILEHRLIMEQHLGRYLEPAEVVHHIDENPSNNAIDNLRLYSSQADHIREAHPTRQRRSRRKQP